jgi:hypothetical protein
VPAVEKEVVQVATPETMVWAEHEPMETPPDLKLTVPVGVEDEPETVAVRVVERATVVGEGEAERATVAVVVMTESESVPVEVS